MLFLFQFANKENSERRDKNTHSALFLNKTNFNNQNKKIINYLAKHCYCCYNKNASI